MLVNPSQLSDAQQAALMTVIDTGGHQFVLSALTGTRTVRALAAKGMAKRVTLEFVEGKRDWWALTIDGRIMREQLSLYLDRRKGTDHDRRRTAE